MNILIRLPDDLQEYISKIIHRDFMKHLKDELWNNLRENQQEYYIETKYKSEYASFCVYTKHDTLQNPDEIAIKGKCLVFEGQDDDWNVSEYNGAIIENPTFGDLLLEAENVITITEYYHHIFLEGFEIYDYFNDITVIVLNLGS